MRLRMMGSRESIRQPDDHRPGRSHPGNYQVPGHYKQKWNRLAVILAKIVIAGCVVLFGPGWSQDVDSVSGLTGLCIGVVMITV